MKMDLHMRIIALGTGESCDHHSTKLNNLAPDIEKIAFHRTFMLLKERGVDVDYAPAVDSFIGKLIDDGVVINNGRPVTNVRQYSNIDFRNVVKPMVLATLCLKLL